MANASWLVVCCSSSALVFLLVIAVVQADFKRTSPLLPTTGVLLPAKNASSSTYFQQVFSKEKAGETSTKIGQTSPRPSSSRGASGNELSSSEAEVAGDQKDLQPRNGNLTGSETRNVYDYEPFQKSDGDNEGADGGGDDYENDDNDDKDYYDDDSGEGERQSAPQDEYA